MLTNGRFITAKEFMRTGYNDWASTGARPD
jgi:hypothetical protein